MRVVIAEDQALLRAGLAGLFQDAGHEVAMLLPDALGLRDALEQTEPDLVVLDVRMPPTYTDEGARAAVEIKRARPHVGVLLLSQHVETTHSVELVRHGGFGYLLKDRVLEVDEFLSAAERVAAGGSALDPQVVGSLVSAVPVTDPMAALTERERDILELMAQGLSNAGIARRLVLSHRTVEAHIRNLFHKIGIVEGQDDHRRVRAVLAYLSARPPQT